MKHAPPPDAYERMTDAVRRKAVVLLREESAALDEATARASARRLRARLESADVGELTQASARRLVHVYVRRHGDTPELQAARRAVHELPGRRKA